MTENQFDELLKAAIQEYGGEYIEIPEKMRKPHHFSRSFERRMQKLIRQAGIQVKHRRLPLRQLIAIIIAAVMVLSAAAMSVSAVRDVIIGFITEVYETFTGVRAEPSEDAPETLEEIYEVTWVPEGYILSEANNSSKNQCELFVNHEFNSYISFDQYLLSKYSANIDNENSEWNSIMIGGNHGAIIERADGYEIAWNNGKYVFEISIVNGKCGILDKEDAVMIADSVDVSEK